MSVYLQGILACDFYNSVLRKSENPANVEWLSKDACIPHEENAISILILDFVSAEDLASYVQYLEEVLCMHLPYWRAVCERIQVELDVLWGLKQKRSQYDLNILLDMLNHPNSLVRYFNDLVLPVNENDYLAPLYGCYESDFHKVCLILLPDSGCSKSSQDRNRRGRAVKLLMHSHEVIETEWTVTVKGGMAQVQLMDSPKPLQLNWNARLQAFDLKWGESGLLPRRTQCVLPVKNNSRPSYCTHKKFCSVMKKFGEYKSRFLAMSKRHGYRIVHNGNNFEYVQILDLYKQKYADAPDWTLAPPKEGEQQSQPTYAMAAKKNKTSDQTSLKFSTNNVEEVKHYNRQTFATKQSRRSNGVSPQQVKRQRRKLRQPRQKRKDSRHNRRKALFL